MRLKIKLLLLSFLFFLFFIPTSVLSQEFKTDYKVEYFLNEKGAGLETSVQFNAKITNLKSEVYVNKLTLIFPKAFEITDLRARDDNGAIQAELIVDQQNSKITLPFSDPQIGKGSENNFYLTFGQKNLFKVNGTVWEVILPTIEERAEGNYQIQVHLPKNTKKKISIAKPGPDLVRNNTIYWNNPRSKTIYAVFGDQQIYDLQLNYSIENPKLFRVYTDVAFPPDMLRQKIYVHSILPKPALTYIDADGNFIGRYYLNPKEKKSIIFRGLAQLFVYPREEVKLIEEKRIASQKKYLLSETNFWSINSIEPYANLKTSDQIYRYLVGNFKYDYQRVSQKILRLGAEQALRNPDRAVCTEFSDSFVALAREKGIWSREIQGYGFSNDPQLRPLSLVGDILHSWPEFFDTNSSQWISVDPTWETTSGIDYFSSFDLNHIAFVIHGKRAEYPLPAGMYKTEDSRDILIKTAQKNPSEVRKVILTSQTFKSSIDSGKKYKARLVVQNTGNVFIYGTPISIKTSGLIVNPNKIIIESLAPLEKKEIEVDYKMDATDVGKGSQNIRVLIGEEEVLSKDVQVSPYYFRIAFYVALLLVVFLVIFLLTRLFLILKRS